MEVRKQCYEVASKTNEFTIVQFNCLDISHHYLWNRRKFLEIEKVYNYDNTIICYFKVKLKTNEQKRNKQST